MTADHFLYHTTSLRNLLSILDSQTLKPKNFDNPFISFSTIPLLHGDISGKEAVLVFDAPALANQVMPVAYNESWAEEYPEQASYIAGEGWREIMEYPRELVMPPDNLSDDEADSWEPDEEAMQAYENEQELEAFLAKESEQEWITKEPMEEVHFDQKALLQIIAKDERIADKIRNILDQKGFANTIASVR